MQPSNYSGGIKACAENARSFNEAAKVLLDCNKFPAAFSLSAIAMPVEGGDAIQVTKAGGWVPRESWDGTQLYFLRGPAKLSIWRMPVAGGDATEVVPGPFTDQFAWDVSRTGLYYARTTSNGYVIQYLGFNANTPTEVFRDESETQHIYLAVSPDEETILFGARPTTRSELMLVENFR